MSGEGCSAPRSKGMKNFQKLVLAAIFSAGAGVMSSANAETQAWNESAIGSFDAIAVTRVSGADLASPGLLSSTAGWTYVGNGNNGFASFSPTTSVDFVLSVLGTPGTYSMFAYDGNQVKDSVLANFNSVIVSPAPGIAPTRAEAFSLAGPVMAVPEPESYALMLAGLGLLGFVARRHKQMGMAA